MEPSTGGEGGRFLLTRPSRDVTAECKSGDSLGAFLLTRPSRDVTLPGRNTTIYGANTISTHTSLAGRDNGGNVFDYLELHFYSHVPRGT